MTTPSDRAPAIVRPEALAAKLEAFAALRNCTTCAHVMEEIAPGQLMCLVCERVAMCPPHEQWPTWVKRFVAFEKLRGPLEHHDWHTLQHAWETALADTMNGHQMPMSMPNPYPYTYSTPPAELWVPVVRRALEWHRAGEPTDIVRRKSA